jgi:hypothetical protein
MDRFRKRQVELSCGGVRPPTTGDDRLRERCSAARAIASKFGAGVDSAIKG